MTRATTLASGFLLGAASALVIRVTLRGESMPVWLADAAIGVAAVMAIAHALARMGDR